MALIAHTVTIDGVEPHGPGPSRTLTLDYVQGVDLGGYLMLRPIYSDGLTFGLTEAVPRTSRAVDPRVGLSWTTPPESGMAEPMGT